MERWAMKVLCAAISFVVITVCMSLPIVLRKWFYQRGEGGLMALRVARCFGGGAFIGAFLLHVLPEVDHMLADAFADLNFDPGYPIAQLIVGCGFFLIMILEKIVHTLTTKGQHGDDEVFGMTNMSGQDNPAGPDGAYRKTSRGTDGTPVAAHYETVDTLREKVRARTMSDGKPPEYHYASHHAQSHAHSHAIPGGGGGGLMKSVVLLFALSLDCIMEGMALGLQSTTEGVWMMLVAIMSHEFIISFTLGLQLIQDNSKLRVAMLAVFYGLTVPLGIAIGTLISELSASAGNFELVSGIMQGITGGVFIYVTFFEIIADEISSDIPVRCILSIVCGFILLALLSLIPHSHGHSHGDDHDHDHDDNVTQAVTMLTTE